MAWTYYPLKFRLLSPLHIGYRKVGNLMQTRQYVPGKNLWAALTARLTRDAGIQDYKCVGNQVHENFRFGYLWPSLDGDKPYLPWKHDDFDYLFLNSYASTALDCAANAALEGSLHETEFIAPVAQNCAQNWNPVYLLGDLWVRGDPLDENKWQRAIERMQLGGERAYGWGRMALCSDWNNTPRKGRTIADYEWNELNEKIVLTLNKDDRITAHAFASGPGSVSSLAGQVEPQVGREWGEYSGQHPMFGGVCFAPGSRVVDPKIEFEIGNNGLWSISVSKA